MYSQQYNLPERFPYTEALDYSNISSIVEAFPHLKNINQETEWNKDNVTGVLIRSANDDNVHKAIKYGIWTTTIKNRARLNQLYIKSMSEQKEVYLFFSVVKSGMFEGVAKLVSGLCEDTFPYWWDDFNHKFKDYFRIEWVYIKDVNYCHFSKLYNYENEEVIVSKDCDLMDTSTTKKMLNVYSKKNMKNKWIFNDFVYMDTREKDYTRRNQNPYLQHYDYNNMQMGYGMGYSGMNPGYMMGDQMIPLPPQMLKPIGPDTKSDLGFLKNPVSKNRKK